MVLIALVVRKKHVNFLALSTLKTTHSSSFHLSHLPTQKMVDKTNQLTSDGIDQSPKNKKRKEKSLVLFLLSFSYS